MAVDYTKVFTILGTYADKIINYYAYIGTFNTDKAAIETILAAQSTVYLGDGLTDLYNEFNQSVSDWEGGLISRMEEVLTDEALIGVNFPFGSVPSLADAFRFLLKDMVANDKNVTASSASVGAPTYDCVNAGHGYFINGSKLDGATPPTAGALAFPEYYDITTQLTPDAETLTFTCIQDSESGTAEGSERFSIRGLGAASGPYSPEGENYGSSGTMTVADSYANALMLNPSFEDWTEEVPDGWDEITGEGGTEYQESTTVVYGDGSSLQINDATTLAQTLDKTRITRLGSYFLSFWARKWTDVASDNTVTVTIADEDGANVLETLTGTPTTTSWAFYSAQIHIPQELTDSLVLSIGVTSFSGDPVIVDNVNLTPCEFIMGVPMMIVAGTEKFLVGDSWTVELGNNSAGKFQSVFRKAFQVQLPTDGTPTISDSLVT